MSAPKVTPNELQALMQERLGSQYDEVLRQTTRDIFDLAAWVNTRFTEIFPEAIKGNCFVQHLISGASKPEAYAPYIRIMRHCFGIELNYRLIASREMIQTGSWRLDNPLWRPKIEVPLGGPYKFSAPPDVKFKVGLREFAGHRLIFAQAPYFERLFSAGFKESEWKEPFPFSQCSAECFLDLRNYLHKECIPDAKNRFEVYRLAAFVGCQDLMQLAKIQMLEHVSINHFLELLSLQMEHPEDCELTHICRWFGWTYYDQVEALDLSSLSCLDTLKLYQWGKRYLCQALASAALVQFKQKLKVDKECSLICDYILNQRERVLREAFLEALKENPALVEPMQKQYWVQTTEMALVDNWKNTVALPYDWNVLDPKLNPKPAIRPPESSLERHFSTYVKNPKYADVTCQVAGQSIPAHRLILSQCEKLNLEQKELAFPGVSYDTFSFFLDYLYSKQLPPADRCIALYKLATFVGNRHLLLIVKSQMMERLQIDNFLEIAQLDVNDQDLRNVCRWFVQTYPHLIAQLNLSRLSALDAAKTYLTGTIYPSSELRKMAIEQFKVTLKLNPEFVEICHFIKSFRIKPLKDVVTEQVSDGGEYAEALKAMLQVTY